MRIFKDSAPSSEDTLQTSNRDTDQLLFKEKLFIAGNTTVLQILWKNLIPCFGHLYKIAKGAYDHVSLCPPERNNSAPTGRIFHKVSYISTFRKSAEKVEVSLRSDKNEECFP